MSTTLTSVEAMAQAIVAAHRATLALPLAPGMPWRPPPRPTTRCSSPRCRPHTRSASSTSTRCAWRAPGPHRTRRTGQLDAAHWPDEPADFDMAPFPREHAFARLPPRDSASTP